MAKELKIRVGEQEGTLTLFDDKAPLVCSRIIESLPLKSAAIIAKVAGLELMMRVPFILDAEPENQVQAQEAGNVCYWGFSQNICIFCEDLPGLGPVSLVGKITKNLAGIRQEALKCKQKQGAEMVIYEA
jgi:hypothetical protein